MLIEIMHNEGGYIRIDEGVLFDIRESREGVTQGVVEASLKLGLFQESERGVFSYRVLENIKRREILVEAGRRGGKKSKRKPKNKPTLSHPKATPQAIEERRGDNKTTVNSVLPKVEDTISSGEIVRADPALTPSHKAKEFFSSADEQELLIRHLISRGKDPSHIRTEVKKFVDYWTERNKSGTKERWQMEKTFELKKRLERWFSNIAMRNPTTKNNQAVKL